MRTPVLRSLYRRLGKRCIDIGLSGAALTLAAPVMVAVAGVLRVKMGSPVLFRQPRIGKGGKVFTILKFRTMSDARGPAGELLSDRERLTGLGMLLRRTSLDELPQLLNVLKGDMSLIGPRPLLVRYASSYSPREWTRHDVRPGITGWAQVNGRNALSWDDRLEFDAQYVDQLGPALDARILLATVAKVVGGHGVQADNTELRPLDEVRHQAAPSALR